MVAAPSWLLALESGSPVQKYSDPCALKSVIRPDVTQPSPRVGEVVRIAQLALPRAFEIVCRILALVRSHSTCMRGDGIRP